MIRMENVARLIERNTLVWERDFEVTPDRLWQAVATKEGLSHWFMPTDAEIEPGGRFSFGGGWEGTVTVVDPPHRIVFTPDDSGEAFLEFRIEATPTGSHFTLTDKMGPAADARKIFGADVPDDLVYQPGGPGTHWSGVASGYHGFVDALEGYLTGHDVPFDHDRASLVYVGLLHAWCDGATRASRRA